MGEALLALLTWLQRAMPRIYFLNILLVRAICLNPAAGDPPTIHRLIYSSIRHELRRFLGLKNENSPRQFRADEAQNLGGPHLS